MGEEKSDDLVGVDETVDPLSDMLGDCLLESVVFVLISSSESMTSSIVVFSSFSLPSSVLSFMVLFLGMIARFQGRNNQIKSWSEMNWNELQSTVM